MKTEYDANQMLDEELRKHNSKIKVIDVPQSTDASDEPFKMIVDDIYWIVDKKGYLVCGTIESGFVDIDDNVLLSNGMNATVKEFDRDNGEWASAGDKIGILLSGIKKGDLDGVENLEITM